MLARGDEHQAGCRRQEGDNLPGVFGIVEEDQGAL
jgi:hypothetical protein